MENNMECPNCAAILINAEHENRIYCEYCGYEKKLAPIPAPIQQNPNVIPADPTVYAEKRKKWNRGIIWMSAFDAVITFFSFSCVEADYVGLGTLMLGLLFICNFSIPWVQGAKMPFPQPPGKAITRFLTGLKLFFLYGLISCVSMFITAAIAVTLWE